MKKLITTFAAGLLLVSPLQAQEVNALVDALVEKKILSPAEAERIQASLAKEQAATSAGKLKLTDSVTELRLSGDARLRYQYDQADAQFDSPTTSGTAAKLGDDPNVAQRSRWRFRLRLNADAKLGKNFFAGVQLQTAQASDSAMQTFGDNTGGDGFDNFNIYISRAFLGWKNDWLTVVVGKQANPFYTTELVWDQDINPSGLTEAIDLGKALFPDSKLSIQLIAGQFIFDDNNEFNLDNDLSTDAYLFVEQVKATYKFNKDTSITIAPGFMSYTAADLTGLRNSRAFTDTAAQGVITTQTTTTNRDRITVTNYDAAGRPTAGRVQTFVLTAIQVTPGPGGETRTVDTDQVRTGDRALTAAELAALPRGTPGAANTQFDDDRVDVATRTTSAFDGASGETRSQYILTAPGEFAFKLAGLKSKFFWDLAYNFNGGERYTQIYRLTGNGLGNQHDSRDDLAWLVGFQLGENKKAGDWSLNLNYREIGITSVDPNLNDSDFALSALNVRGFKGIFAYNFTDWLSASVSYAHAWNLKDNLIGGFATNAPAIADINDVDVFQVDLNWKF